MKASSLQKHVENDLWRLTSVDGVSSRLPDTMTITMPGASREQLADLSLALRHDGFGTESFPMFFNGLQHDVAEAKEAFIKGDLKLSHFEAIERSTKYVSKAMQRAKTNIKDWMTMLFGATASREKDN